MKNKIILLSFVILSFCGALKGQVSSGDTYRATIADILTQLPAKDQATYNKQMKELLSTGEQGVLLLVEHMHATDKVNHSLLEYALSGMTHYVSGADQSDLRKMLVVAYHKALDKTLDRESKALIIRQLAFIGTPETVLLLSRYLKDDSLSGPAARAMAAIGEDNAVKILLDALNEETLTSKSQMDVVLALSTFQDPKIEPTLLHLLSTTSEVDKQLLYYALSRNGTKESLHVLSKEIKHVGFKPEKTDVDDAYLFLINRLFQEGKVKEAEIAANNLLREATKVGATEIRIATFRLICSFQGKGVSKMIFSAMKDHSRAFRNAALDEASSIADEAFYRQLLKMLNRLPSDVKVDVLRWFAREAMSPHKREILSHLEVGVEKSGISYLLAQINHSSFEVKEAAAVALGCIGSRQVIPSIANLLTSEEPSVVALGRSVLASFDGTISAEVVRVLPTASSRGKVAGLELLALRESSDQLNAVLALTKDEEKEVREAAYNTLKDVVSEKDFTLICGLLETADPLYVPFLQQALIATLSNHAAAEKRELLFRRMLQASDRTKHLYYLPLSYSGDLAALTFIAEGFEKSRGEAKESAFEALLLWDGFEVVDVLYTICQDETAGSYFDRAIEAYVRVLSRVEMTGENRLIFLRKAMELATKDRLRKTILSNIGRSGTYLALLYAGEWLDDELLKETAASAVMNIALAHPEYSGRAVENLLNKAAAALNNSEAEYQRQSIREHLEKMPKERGFVPLFNGNDLTGWKGLVENPLVRSKMSKSQLSKAQVKADGLMRGSWSVINGELVFNGKGDNICTEKLYGDFEMYVDWRLDPDGDEPDAGIYLRGTPQVQIWDTSRVNVGAQVGSGGLYNNSVHESKPLKVADNKLGEWNTFYIKMVGDRVTVKLNGELVVDDIIMENYWDRALPIPAIEQIELQAHGSKVYYRNLYIKEIEQPEPFKLSAEEEKAGFHLLFDGTTMDAWRGNLKEYIIEEGAIVFKPGKTFGGNLYTKKEYSDFILRFDFQLTPAANNGLGIRTPLTGDPAYVGMELQILDNEHSVYSKLHDYQYHGSVYGVIPAKRGYLKDTGEWNSQEVIANGSHITVTLNGEVILDGDIKEASKGGTIDKKEHPGLLNKKGHIGFLGHGSIVKFRNIRVKTL